MSEKETLALRARTAQTRADELNKIREALT